MLPIRVHLERNNNSDRLSIPYIAHVECDELITFGTKFQLPIRATYVANVKMFNVDVCGFRMMTEHLKQLPELIQKLMTNVARSGRLPTYVFIARDAGTIYPVYTVNDEVLAPTASGMFFRHVELAKVRSLLSDYLHETGILGTAKHADKLHVRGVSRDTLQLKRPRFYLKKRVVGQEPFWAPVFKSSDGTSLYTYAASKQRVVLLEDGLEVLMMQKVVAAALIEQSRLQHPHDLRVDRMFADNWRDLERHLIRLSEQDLHLSGMVIPVYQSADATYFGLERRAEEDRYGLHMGDSIETLKGRILQDLNRRGITNSDE